MKIEVNIEKRYAIAIFVILLIAVGVFLVNVYGGNDPVTTGHSFNEIEDLGLLASQDSVD